MCNPADGEIIGTIPAMTTDEIRETIDHADRAWRPWQRLTGKERANRLRAWYDLIIQNQDDIAMLMTSEQGKPLAEARGEIVYAASFLEWFAEEAKRIYGDTIDHPLPGRRIVVIKQGIGVSAAITPWNFPAAMITRKCGRYRSPGAYCN